MVNCIDQRSLPKPLKIAQDCRGIRCEANDQEEKRVHIADESPTEKATNGNGGARCAVSAEPAKRPSQ
jgi:hypothetical protein